MKFLKTYQQALCNSNYTIFIIDIDFRAVKLDTGPSAPPTHWKQTVIVVPRLVFFLYPALLFPSLLYEIFRLIL